MSTNTILDLVGKVVTLAEIHAAVKSEHYELVTSGIAGYDGQRRMAMVGDCRYKRPDGATLLVEFQGMCDHCPRPLDRWTNWYAAKENDDELIAVCAGGHATSYGENGDQAKVKVLAVRML